MFGNLYDALYYKSTTVDIEGDEKKLIIHQFKQEIDDLNKRRDQCDENDHVTCNELDELLATKENGLQSARDGKKQFTLTKIRHDIEELKEEKNKPDIDDEKKRLLKIEIKLRRKWERQAYGDFGVQCLLRDDLMI